MYVYMYPYFAVLVSTASSKNAEAFLNTHTCKFARTMVRARSFLSTRNEHANKFSHVSLCTCNPFRQPLHHLFDGDIFTFLDGYGVE